MYVEAAAGDGDLFGQVPAGVLASDLACLIARSDPISIGGRGTSGIDGDKYRQNRHNSLFEDIRDRTKQKSSGRLKVNSQ